MDVKFFKPFIDGTLNTMKVQFKTEALAGKPFFKNNENAPKFSIAAILGITSPAFTGSIAICYPAPVFLGLMNRMLRDNFTEITKDLEDGAAEMLNIIFGHAKTILNSQGYTLNMAIPTVIRGESISTRVVAQNPTVVLPFTTDLGEFSIEICTIQALGQAAGQAK